MKQEVKVTVLSGVITILANLPINAAGLPCAAEYKEYRRRLIAEKWIPVAVANNVKGFTEVVSGTRLASATWLDPSESQKNMDSCSLVGKNEIMRSSLHCTRLIKDKLPIQDIKK